MRHLNLCSIYMSIFLSFTCCTNGCNSGKPDASPDAGDAGPVGSGVLPRLIAPLSTTMVREDSPVLKWTGHEDDTYLLEVSADKEFNDIEYVWSGKGFEHVVSEELLKGPHFWRVSVPANPEGSRLSYVWEVFSGTVPYDVNGDGYSDILVGSWEYNLFYLFYGGPDIAGNINTDDADVEIDPGSNSFGNMCSIFSDMTGDGLADIVFNQAMGNGGIFICPGGNLSGNISWGSCHNLKDDPAVQFDTYGMPFVNNGDMDLDGHHDLITAAPHADITSNQEGIVYLYLSHGEPISEIDDRDDYDWAFYGQEEWESVRPLEMFSDLNGDGFSELCIGDRIGPGNVWIELGSDTLAGNASPDDIGISLGKESEEDKWLFNADGLDINGDGYGEAIVAYRHGSEFWIYVFYGRQEIPSQLLPTDFGLAVLHPAQIGMYETSINMFGPGDVNGDGYADFGFTHFGNMGPAWEPAVDPLGAVHLVYGGPDLPDEMDADDSDIKIIGNGDPWFANYASGVGDVNGDGYMDFAVSATGDEIGGDDLFPGRVFVFFGGPTLEQKVTADDADLIISATLEDQAFGMCINRGGV